MIQYHNITKIYTNASQSVALQDVSLGIAQGEFVSLVGKSGAGKTTLLKLLLAEERPTQGRVLFQGDDVHQIPYMKLPQLRRRIGVVFQDYRLLSQKTAYENVAYVMEMLGAEDDEIERDVKEVLDIVGLSERALHFPAQLSGGEKQRVAIARALIHRPQVIIADEPTGNLDPYNARDIVDLLLKINELGTTILLATHNKEIVNKASRRVVALEDGKIVRDHQKGRFVI